MLRPSPLVASLFRIMLIAAPITMAFAAVAQTGTPCTNTDLPPNLQPGLEFYAPFCGNANDLGSGAHSGLVNGASLSTDRFQNPDSAYSFNGTDNSLNFGQVPEVLGHDSLTICFWLKHQTHANYQYDVVLGNAGLLGQGGCGYQCYIHNATGKLRFEYRYSPTATIGYVSNWNTAVPTNTWTFYAVTYRKAGSLGAVYLYRNGVLDGSFSYANPINYAVPAPLRVGTNVDTTLQRFYSGQIDDIMIYSRFLSAAEIGQIYNGFIGPAEVKELEASPYEVYPNPVSDVLTISGPVGEMPSMITLVDATGRVVLRQGIRQWPMALGLGGLEPGLYTLLFDDRVTGARRVAKQ